MAKRLPQQQRSKATVERITRAATQILVKSGYAALSTNAVAAKASVSVASVYEYFDDKEDLLVAVLEQEMAAIWATLEARLPRWLAADVDTALHDLFSLALDEITQRPELVRLAAEYVWGPSSLPAAARFISQIEMLFRLLLGKFSRSPSQDAALDAYLVTHGFIGICNGIASGLPPGKTPDDVVAWLVRFSKAVIAA